MINQNETAKRYIALSEFKLLKLFKIAVIFSIYTFFYEVLAVYCTNVMSDGIGRAWTFRSRTLWW